MDKGRLGELCWVMTGSLCFIEAGSLYITVGPSGAFKISLGVICISSRVAGTETKRDAKMLFSAN